MEGLGFYIIVGLLASNLILLIYIVISHKSIKIGDVFTSRTSKSCAIEIDYQPNSLFSTKGKTIKIFKADGAVKKEVASFLVEHRDTLFFVG